MKITGLEDALTDIYRHSDQLILQQKRYSAPEIHRRAEQINGMLELVDLLTRAGYTVPALLYGFLRYELERVENSIYLRRVK